MYDSFGRRIDYLRISVTDKCNLRCTYCMPAEGVPHREHDEMLRNEQFLAVVAAAARLGVTKVRVTGGEPLVRRGIVELVRGIAETPGITKVALTTNGVLLRRLARPLRSAGLTHLNISIDTLDPERYSIITRGGRLEHAIAGALAAKAVGFELIKINTVVPTGGTASDEIAALRAFCEQHGFALQRISEYSLAEHKRDGMGLERPLPCAECNRLRLLADGTLKPCLHSEVEIPVDFSDVEASLRRAVDAKPRHGSVCRNRPMMQIGG